MLKLKKRPATSSTPGTELITRPDGYHLAEVIGPPAARERDQPQEALWLQLQHPTFITTAIVGVPGITSDQSHAFARRAAGIGAIISDADVRIVDARGVGPYDAPEATRQLRELIAEGGPVIVVADSPTQDHGSLPILDLCPRILLLVGLGRSTTRQLRKVHAMLGDAHDISAICIESGRAPGRTAERP
jgi:hypothetical protein